MKLLMVTSGYPPDFGGLEAHVSHIAEGVAAHGADVTVVAYGPQSERTESIENGVRVLRFPVNFGTRSLPVSTSLSRWVRAQGSEYDLVHAHQFHAMPALAAARARPKHLVFTPHYNGSGHNALRHFLHFLYRPAARLIFRRADLVVSVSNAESDLLQRHFSGIASKITVIPNGVHQKALEAAAPFSEPGAIVLTVGRVERYKGIGTTVRAIGYLDPRFRLVVIGDGPDRSRLQHLADRLGLSDRVTFTGNLPAEELHRWYRTADTYVSLSTREAFGIAALEAAASGARVIVSDIAAHRDVFRSAQPGAAMMLPPNCDPQALAHTITVSEQLGRVKKNAEFPSWEQAVSRTIELYESLISA